MTYTLARMAQQQAFDYITTFISQDEYIFIRNRGWRSCLALKVHPGNVLCCVSVWHRYAPYDVRNTAHCFFKCNCLLFLLLFAEDSELKKLDTSVLQSYSKYLTFTHLYRDILPAPHLPCEKVMFKNFGG